MLVYVHDAEKENISPKGVIMEKKKELSKVILDTCDKELDGSIGFMLTEREADIFATAILSAGWIKKSEIEQLLLEADSMLSYIRHRCEVSKMGQLTYAEIDNLIGKLRRHTHPT